MTFIKTHKITLISSACALALGWGGGYWHSNHSFQRAAAKQYLEILKDQKVQEAQRQENFAREREAFDRRFNQRLNRSQNRGLESARRMREESQRRARSQRFKSSRR